MEIQEQRQGAVTVIKPIGPLVGNDAEEFKKKVEEATSAKCVVLAPGETWTVEG